MIAAFSAAIFSTVSPRNSMWSMEIGVITLTSAMPALSTRATLTTSASSTTLCWACNWRTIAW